MVITVKTSQGNYDIHLQRGVLKEAGRYLNLDRKVMVVTDSGVPSEYSDAVASQCRSPYRICIPQGEINKNMEHMTDILSALVKADFTRTDCVVAVGGGVVGDMAGFAAACYMRGIDFYNIPTTVLSQVDSSIGGKTAVDFGGYKNIVGAFWQPKGVLIDPDTLRTLSRRLVNNGLAEALKMSVTSDPELFELFENGDVYENIDTVIEKALLVKKSVVEQDEREGGLRKILNFGHTLAHALESADGMSNYLHGECVAIGMVPMCSDNVREKLVPVLKKLDLPVYAPMDPEKVAEAVKHDKNASGDMISVVYVPQIGSWQINKVPISDIEEKLRKAVSA